jgi:hypothetical protein
MGLKRRGGGGAENISAIKLEEMARATLAEAKYNHVQESILKEKHLEGENLSLEVTDNQQRGEGGESLERKGKKKARGDRLSRELKRISYK